jgi:dTDP-4-amino-4,6-dideoxygalactose transaminase
MRKIEMVDLKTQYQAIQQEIDSEVIDTIRSTRFIGGDKVSSFAKNLQEYLGVKHVIPCGNGTDALQIALMALPLDRGDEIIVPSFTFIATAEVIGLLGFHPVMVDVDPGSFNITPDLIEASITPKTKAIMPVHLFGQNADMDGILELAEKHNLYVIEDAAQSIGSKYIHRNETVSSSGTMGHIGCTSFFPSKNLGCYGDGGAIFTNDDKLRDNIAQIANHGMSTRYYHDQLGVNSRLDSIQAAILNVKLKHLDTYSGNRKKAASFYSEKLSPLANIQTPVIASFTDHVFHQYTLRILDGTRDQLKAHLDSKEIPNNIYYPVPMHKQKAFEKFAANLSLPVTEKLSTEVVSLPMHSELDDEQLTFITNQIISFYNG